MLGHLKHKQSLDYIKYQQVCAPRPPYQIVFRSFVFLRTGYLFFLGHISRHYSDQLFLPNWWVQGGPT